MCLRLEASGELEAIRRNVMSGRDGVEQPPARGLAALTTTDRYEIAMRTGRDRPTRSPEMSGSSRSAAGRDLPGSASAIEYGAAVAEVGAAAASAPARSRTLTLTH